MKEGMLAMKNIARTMMYFGIVAIAMFLIGCAAGMTDMSASNSSVEDGAGTSGGDGSEPIELSGLGVTISSSTIVRLDGTELDFSQGPIPRKVQIKYALDSTLPEASDRESFERSVGISDSQGNSVGGTYSWSADYSTATYSTTGRLEYGTQYTVVVDSENTTSSFTTMTRGDVDGDGKADLGVGAYNADAGGTDRGQAYFFISGLSGTELLGGLVPGDAYLTISATENSASLGNYVSTVGDFNADGYSDMTIGAAMTNGGGNDRGQVIIFFGGSSLSSALSIADFDVVLTGSDQSGYFGSSASAAGDLNGDGYDDLVVGAYGAGDNNQGEAYIFLGGPTLAGEIRASTADTTITGNANSDRLGFLNSISAGGDVNGDGIDDLIVGAYQAAANKGQAYVFFGSENGIDNCALFNPCQADITFNGDAILDYLGFSVSIAGDVNGDGIDDIAIGAFGAGDNDEGQVMVFFGSPGYTTDSNSYPFSIPNSSANATLTGFAANDRFGSVVSTAGDVNNDGYDDLIVGAFQYFQATTNKGVSYYYRGDWLTGDLSTSDGIQIMQGDRNNDYFGFYGTIGDLNGDDYDDIAIGAYGADTNSGESVNSGALYIYLGADGNGLDGNGVYDAIVTGASAGDSLGSVY